jgi:hypothetical protein
MHRHARVGRQKPFKALESALMRLFNSRLRCVHDLCTGAAAAGGQEKEEERRRRGWEKGQKEEIEHPPSLVEFVLKEEQWIGTG